MYKKAFKAQRTIKKKEKSRHETRIKGGMKKKEHEKVLLYCVKRRK